MFYLIFFVRQLPFGSPFNEYSSHLAASLDKSWILCFLIHLSSEGVFIRSLRIIHQLYTVCISTISHNGFALIFCVTRSFVSLIFRPSDFFLNKKVMVLCVGLPKILYACILTWKTSSDVLIRMEKGHGLAHIKLAIGISYLMLFFYAKFT